MKLKPIPYQSGFIFVDESANIEKGDYYWDRWNPCGTTAYQDAYMDAAKEIINLIKQK